ncbi:UbiA family prenyltransferase [Candidatus Micrarchaeota archaeon]|nr:UbiA family prenyltransferase [Candidatus Micrarchaeota archaeon]
MAFSNPPSRWFSTVFSDIENTDVQPAWCVLTLAAVVFIRIILEWTLEAQKTVEPLQSLLLFFLYFSAVLCVMLVLLWRFSGKPLVSALKVVTAFSPVLWIPPFVDFILSSGSGFSLTYMFNPGSFVDGLTSFCASCSGVSNGLRIEVLVAILVAAAYVWHASRNAVKTVAVAALFYLFVIVQAFLPGFFMAQFGHVFPDVFLFREIVSTYALMFAIAVLWASKANWAYETTTFQTTTAEWLAQLRLERSLHYVGLVLMGALIGKASWGHIGWGAVLPLASLCAGIFLAFQAAVWLNDYFDIGIDRITSPKKKTDAQPFARIALFYVSGILCAWAAGYVAAALMLFASALSIVYSVPPLRLRRHFVLASMVLAGCSLSVFLAGLTVGLAQPETGLDTPKASMLTALIFGFVVLASQFKDLKDAKGDRKNGVFTLPGWLGVKTAKNIIAILILLAVLWASWLSGLFWPIGVAFGLAGASAVALISDFKKMETAVFVLDYAFMAVLALHLSGIVVLS